MVKNNKNRFLDINYFHCQKIVEILRTTEADTKNVFGRFGSQRMKDWQDVIKKYEKDSVYLAEAAQVSWIEWVVFLSLTIFISDTGT